MVSYDLGWGIISDPLFAYTGLKWKVQQSVTVQPGCGLYYLCGAQVWCYISHNLMHLLFREMPMWGSQDTTPGSNLHWDLFFWLKSFHFWQVNTLINQNTTKGYISTVLLLLSWRPPHSIYFAYMTLPKGLALQGDREKVVILGSRIPFF